MTRARSGTARDKPDSASARARPPAGSTSAGSTNWLTQVLLPPGMHQWKSPTMVYRNSFDLNNNVVRMVLHAHSTRAHLAYTQRNQYCMRHAFLNNVVGDRAGCALARTPPRFGPPTRPGAVAAVRPVPERMWPGASPGSASLAQPVLRVWRSIRPR